MNLADISLPNLDLNEFRPSLAEQLVAAKNSSHKPRILLLYGSLRDRSCSRNAESAAELSLRVNQRTM